MGIRVKLRSSGLAVTLWCGSLLIVILIWSSENYSRNQKDWYKWIKMLAVNLDNYNPSPKMHKLSFDLFVCGSKHEPTFKNKNRLFIFLKVSKQSNRSPYSTFIYTVFLLVLISQCPFPLSLAPPEDPWLPKDSSSTLESHRFRYLVFCPSLLPQDPSITGPFHTHTSLNLGSENERKQLTLSFSVWR